MKAIMDTYWNRSDVRNLCVRNNWYTGGDNREYSSMLDYVEKNSAPSTTNMMKVARDIAAHSSDLDPDNIEHVCYIMKELERNCIKRFFFLTKEEGDAWPWQ